MEDLGEGASVPAQHSSSKTEEDFSLLNENVDLNNPYLYLCDGVSIPLSILVVQVSSCAVLHAHLGELCNIGCLWIVLHTVKYALHLQSPGLPNHNLLVAWQMPLLFATGQTFKDTA